MQLKQGEVSKLTHMCSKIRSLRAGRKYLGNSEKL